ncbi:MAG: BrnT family toxin [Acidobacteriota bacterium]|nr:BrnT family toxin [Acidobacteriota bacterium]
MTVCTLVHTIAVYEWDPAKAQRNLRKHGVDFADAVVALEDELALTMRDPSAEGEQRFVTMGTDALGRLLAVVYAWRAERIRIISAREATGGERRRYEAG